MSLLWSIKHWISNTGELLTKMGKRTGITWAAATTAWYVLTMLNPLMFSVWLPTLALGVTTYAAWQLLQTLMK